MKVIISHDVDHLTFSEHWRDPVLPKLAVRSLIERSAGTVTAEELLERARAVRANTYHNLDAVLRFDVDNEVPATFFVAVARGRGIAYSSEAIRPWVQRIRAAGFGVGVHGVAWEGRSGLEREYRACTRLLGEPPAGIRMHYLHPGFGDPADREQSLRALAGIGYRFSSNLMGLRAPFRVGNIWELPLQVMDGYVLMPNRRWQSDGLDAACRRTRGLFDAAEERGLDYLSVLVHDSYQSPAFATFLDWYRWLVRWCRDRGHRLISCGEACDELDASCEGVRVRAAGTAASVLTNPFQTRAMQRPDLPQVTKLHLRAFPDSMNTDLGHRYVARLLSWYVSRSDAVALVAEGSQGVLGYAVGAPAGYQAGQTYRLALAAALAMALRPALLGRPDVHSVLIARARSLAAAVLGHFRTAKHRKTPGPRSLSLVGIGVTPQWQGNGVGSLLLAAFEKEARLRGMDQMTLTVHRDNAAAIRAYRRNGWHELAGAPGSRSIIMVKPLVDDSRR